VEDRRDEDEVASHFLRTALFCESKSPFVAALLRLFQAEWIEKKDGVVRFIVGELTGNSMLVLPGIRLAGLIVCSSVLLLSFDLVARGEKERTIRNEDPGGEFVSLAF
jgi:hypothetical protein